MQQKKQYAAPDFAFAGFEQEDLIAGTPISVVPSILGFGDKDAVIVW